MKSNIFFNYLIKFLWLLVLVLIVFIDSDNIIMVLSTIAVLLIACFITVVRSLISRNEWRKMIEDGEIEVKEKIKF